MATTRVDMRISASGSSARRLQHRADDLVLLPLQNVGMLGAIAHRFDIEATDELAGDAIEIVEYWRDEALIEAVFEQAELLDHRDGGRMAGGCPAIDLRRGERLDQKDGDVTLPERVSQDGANRPRAGDDDPILLTQLHGGRV